MEVVVVQQPSTTTSVGVPLAVPPTLQVYAIRMPVGPDGNLTGSATLANLSPRHHMALRAVAAVTDEQPPNARELLKVMVGSMAVNSLTAKQGVLANQLAVTTNGNLTFSQLALQLDLTSYALLKFVQLSLVTSSCAPVCAHTHPRFNNRATVAGGATTSLLQINPIEVVDTPSRITVQQNPPASVYVGQSVRTLLRSLTESITSTRITSLPLNATRSVRGGSAGYDRFWQFVGRFLPAVSHHERRSPCCLTFSHRSVLCADHMVEVILDATPDNSYARLDATTVSETQHCPSENIVEECAD
jgi:hypothetical protein